MDYWDKLKLLLSDKETADSIEPTDSPIDYLAGMAGAKLGGALVKDAGKIVGNEIGAIGRDVAESGKFARARSMLNPKTVESAEMLPSKLDEAQALARAGSGVEGKALNILDRNALQSNANEKLFQKERFDDQLKQVRLNKIKELLKSKKNK